MVVFFSVLALWIVSLCLHEYAHARVAFAGGDTSVVDKGYLTMNPLKYLHPVMSVIIPLVILAIGGIPLPGGAVYIDHSRLRSREWEALVSAAGPAANLVLLIVCGAAFRLGLLELDPENGLSITIALFGFFQALAVVLNLLPIPGLDGFGILAPYLPREVQRQAYQMANVAFIVLIVMLWRVDPVRDWFYRTVFQMTDGVGIPLDLMLAGWKAFKIF